MSSFIEDYNRWKKTGKFDEEKKDKKSIAKTGVTGANYIGQGVLKGAESIFVDTPLLIAGGIRKLFGDDKGANDLFEASNVSLTNMAINKLSGNEANPYLNNNQNLFNEELDKNSLIKENNIGGKVAQGVGEMLPTIALAGGLNGVGKVAKTAKQLDTARKVGANTLLGAKAFSGATNEAYQESGDIGKSMLYGLGNAGVEIATEQISGGIPGLKQIKGDTTKNILKNYGKSVIGEGVEEIAADLANPILKTIYQGKDALKQYGNADYWKGVAESGLVGAATGAILDIPNTASSLKTNKVGKNTQINRVVTQEKNNSAEISQKEAPQGTKVNLPINTNQDAEIVKNKVNLPPIQSDLNQQITQMRENDTNLPKIDQNRQKISNQINEIENKVNNLSDNSATFAQDNKTIGQYEYKKSDNSKIDNLRQDAAKLGWDNSEKTNNYMNMLEQIIFDKDVEIRFDPNLTDNLGRAANGKYENGVITINPNSTRAGEFIAIHELTHAIGTDSMKSIVENYRKSNQGFDKAVTELLGKNYNTNELTEEAMADVAGQLFGNQEFINNLSQTNPSLFRKIYNEIKYLWHQFTGYKNQNQFIEDLQYKWEQAYKNNKELNNTTSLLKGKLTNGEDIVVSDDKNGSHPTRSQVQSSLENMLGIKYNNQSSNQLLEITDKDIKKYLNDGYNNNKNMNLKKRISGNYGEILEISKIDPSKSKSNYKGTNRGKNGFDYYNVNLAYPVKDANGNIVDYRYYEARLVVRKEPNGNFAYDLDNFNEKKGLVLDEKTSSIMADKSADESFTANNISQSNKNVKSNISTKYSIQESQNNSLETDEWQEYLESNFESKGTKTNFKDMKLPTKKQPNIPIRKDIPKDPTKESSYDVPKKTRKEVQGDLLTEMGITVDDISKGKDITALDFQRTDPIRLNEKVFGHETGNKVNDATIRKTKHNEADRIRFLNKEREEIKSLGIKARSKESAAVQKYAEKEYTTEHGDVKPYGDIELAEEFEDIATQEKIKKAANALRNKYDRYIEQINNVITEMGYDPIPKRKDYMRHFQEIGDKLSQWGIPLNPSDMSKDTIPTDINGITDQFKPGKNWFASAMQRKGVKTVYDAITGIDGYLEGASNLMYHTEDIQRYRALSKFIRETYGQQHGLENVDLGTEEGQKRLKDIYDAKLSKYVAWLDEQANALAGKKGGIDRAAERLLGRKIYTILETAKKQVGSNMTGFNVRSALTNFASAVQGASKTNKKAFLKGTISTINNIIHNDGLINKSDFLTSRFGSDTLSKKLWQKASNAGQILMTGSDYFTANQIWRSKYYENLSKGMNETQAIKNADDFASRIMGDRSKGSTAEIFNSKTLGLLTQFQLEVNNQWSSIIHDNKMDIQSGNKSGATVMFQLGQLAALSYFFNNIMKSLTGSDVMIDPIDMLKKLLGADDDKEKTLEERATEVLGDLVNDLPFASMMNGGRIPMAEAFNGAGTAFKKLTGQKDKYGNDIEWKDVGKDLITSGAYWLLPTGYGQLNKTTKGLSMYDTEKIVNNLSQDVDIAKKYLDDNKVKYGAGDNILQLAEKHGIKEYLNQVVVPGSYTDSGNLRFTADESTSGKIKAALFGQYSTDEGRKYRESNYKTIEFPHIKEMKDLDMKASEYRNYRTKLSEAGRKDIEKIEYIKKSDYSEKQKNIMYKNVLDMKPEELTRVNNLMNISEQNRYMIAKSKSNSINSNENLSSEEKHKQIAQSIIDTNINNKAMAYLYSKFYSTEEMMDSLSAVNIPIKEFIKYNSQNLKSDYDSRTGKAISGSREKKVISYINSLNLSIPQKALLIKLEYNSYNAYNSDILKYITSSDANYINKAYLVKRAGFSNYNKEIINYVQKNYKTATEKEKILKSLGFNIKNGRVYY